MDMWATVKATATKIFRRTDSGSLPIPNPGADGLPPPGGTRSASHVSGSDSDPHHPNAPQPEQDPE